MNTEINEAVENLKKALLKNCNGNTVAVSVFFNYQGHSVDIQERTAEELENSGISMRNLKGDFIK